MARIVTSEAVQNIIDSMWSSLDVQTAYNAVKLNLLLYGTAVTASGERLNLMPSSNDFYGAGIAQYLDDSVKLIHPSIKDCFSK